MSERVSVRIAPCAARAGQSGLCCPSEDRCLLCVSASNDIDPCVCPLTRALTIDRLMQSQVRDGAAVLRWVVADQLLSPPLSPSTSVLHGAESTHGRARVHLASLFLCRSLPVEDKRAGA